ncbi:MAG: transcriptional regulator [Aquificales bacterium]|nr:transcriptional regulator [Aquificales bacterium]
MVGLQGADINWGLIIPTLFISLLLMVLALVDLVQREKTRGPKWLWVLVIVFINFIGPLLYLFIGRDD